MVRTVPLALLLLAACSNRREIHVEVRIPDPDGVETPIPGVRVAALPYDRDSIIVALEARASEARPHTKALDSLFQAFRAPFVGYTRLAWLDEQLRRRRDAAGSDSARAVLDDSVARLAPELERARADLDGARRTLWPGIDSLRSEVRRWEETVYAGYDTLVTGLTRDRMREGIQDTTDARGGATITVGPGRWWIHARSPDPQDPNAEWYWNAPLRGDTVLLTPATGSRRPRYGS